MATIKLNVGGTYFETTMSTIERSKYLEAYVTNWKRDEEVIFIDRSPHIFKHVISLLRDISYPYPSKYVSELEFYGIEYQCEKEVNHLEHASRRLKKIRICMRDELSKIKEATRTFALSVSDECRDCKCYIKKGKTHCPECVLKRTNPH